MQPLTFPPTVLVSALQVPHPEYDADTLAKYSALYSAGKEFDKLVDQFLIKRPVEELTEGAKHYELRKKKAWYIPRGAGLIDYFVAAILKSPPKIESEDPYWQSLNNNADGLGQDLEAFTWKLQTEKLIANRSYISVIMPGEIAVPSDKKTMEARLSTLTAAEVDNWGVGPRGELLWIRKKSDMAESGLFGPSGVTHHTRTYITDKEIAVYEWTSTKDEKPDPKKEAKLRGGVVQPHSYNHLPVYPVLGGKGCWIMDRISKILIALFNREVSVTYALDQMAYPLLVFSLKGSDLKCVLDASIGAIILKENEKAEYVQVNPQSFEPIFKDVTRLSNALYEVIQSLAINAAATQTQNARQSAEAKEIDRSPLNTYLNSLASPVEDALEKCIKELAEYREDAPDVAKLTGMDVFEADAAELEKVVKGPGEPEPVESEPKQE